METKEKNFWWQLFSDKNHPSSKRFVGIVGATSLFVTMFANSFTDISKAPSEALVNAVALLSFAALGLTSSERIFKQKNQENG